VDSLLCIKDYKVYEINVISTLREISI